MIKRAWQLISAGLAAGLVIAGIAAASPLWHLWIEHGGSGPLHTHRFEQAPLRRAPLRAFSLGLGAKDPGRGAAVVERVARPAGGDQPSGEATVSSAASEPGRDLDEPSEGGAGSEPVPSGPSNGHQHHSLPQLLGAGLVESSWPATPMADLPLGRVQASVSLTKFSPLDSFDAQQAARGPPCGTS